MDRNKQVEETILKGEKKNYIECLRNASWETFYQMSTLREGLINWYEFEKHASCLYISDGYGALTELLCRNVGKVVVAEREAERIDFIRKRGERYSNLTVKNADVKSLDRRESYDYIVVEQCIRTKHEMCELLEMLLPILTEQGRLLFCCENRLGMRYLCGVPDGLSGEPFAGIREKEHLGRLTKVDVEEILGRTREVKGWKLYYPAPDEKLPQAIYTEEYLPSKSIRDRVIPYYTDKETLVALEDEFCDALIANNVYNIFANAFLVECSKNGLLSDVVFAAVSTDRGDEHGFATIISNTGNVKKKALHQKGMESLAQICGNSKELSQHGVLCVEQSLKDNQIEMPYIKCPTLINYIKMEFDVEPERVIGLFDDLYKEILKSSEHVPSQNCCMEIESAVVPEVGTILRKAYIDMIPYNCFYADGKIVFYDQEFVKENFPAKYVLFRALRYTYIYIPDADDKISLQYFKDRYELNKLWEIFEREEAKFVEDNRNYDMMTAFYQWANVDRKELENNIKRLRGIHAEIKPERIYNDYRIERKSYDIELYKKDYRLNAVKNVQMQMLKTIIAICQENDLSYCVFYGTLLGAVRHRGYVPWDDDMDVAMSRADYDRFIVVAPNYLPEYYFLQTPENDSECFYGGYCKLRDSRTTGIEERNKGHHCNQGIWIDIFPLDAVLLDEEEQKIRYQKIVHYQRLLMKKSYPEKRMLWDVSREEEAYYQKEAEIFSRNELCDALHEIFVNCGGKMSAKVAVMARYMGNQQRIEYDALDFEFLTKGKFEEIEIFLPCGYENILKLDYGKDYMLYPKREERKPHHKAIFDTKKSYVDYLGENGYNV